MYYCHEHIKIYNEIARWNKTNKFVPISNDQNKFIE